MLDLNNAPRIPKNIVFLKTLSAVSIPFWNVQLKKLKSNTTKIDSINIAVI